MQVLKRVELKVLQDILVSIHAGRETRKVTEVTMSMQGHTMASHAHMKDNGLGHASTGHEASSEKS